MSPTEEMAARRRAALDAVRRACRLTRRVQETLVGAALARDAMAKEDHSPVTVADFGAQASISLDLGRALPGEPIMGEENADFLRSDAGAALRERVTEEVRRVQGAEHTTDAVLEAIDRCAQEAGTSPGYWILDPIDGTKGFLRHGQYAVALAWTVDHQVELGLLGCPNLPLDGASDGKASDGQGPTGAILIAQRGAGTRLYDLEGREIRPVATARDLALGEGRLCESVEPAHSALSLQERIARRLGITAPPVRMDSQCKYAAIARGDATVYLRLPRRADYEEKVWDHAAGYLVVREAGGRVTDAVGRELDFSLGRTLRANRGIVATSGPFHDEVIAAVQAETATS